MNWRKYKSLSPQDKRDESYYIIGLDIGNDSSGIAFYNLATNAPETIDLSGGYGKPSIPTAVQYIEDTSEWVFGEYAVLNRGAGTEITLDSLVERLGSFDHIDIGRRSLSMASVLGLFIKEILGNVRSINPKAEIVGIVATVPAYFSEQAYDEFTRAFKFAGYEKELIALVPDRECVLAHYYKNPPQKEERALLLDFGARELRGGLYSINSTTITSMSSLFNDQISMTQINNDIANFFETLVLKEVSKDKPLGTGQLHQLREQVTAFSYQHRDMLFQKNIRVKPIRMYFNFTYPPFQQTISNAQIQELIRPYARRFNAFIKDVIEKSISNTTLTTKDVDRVLCVGGGFEMLWAREAVSTMFTQVNFYKSPKIVTCEGAATVAAQALGISEAGTPLTLEDTHQLTWDIGLSDGKNFLPLVERNVFWWQTHPQKLILINQEITGKLDLNLCMRIDTALQSIASIQLRALPHRPKGTTRLGIGFRFISNTEAVVTIRDMGFGDLFPQTDYVREVPIRIDTENINLGG